MSKKSAKKRQPVKPVVAKEPARTAKNFGYEEMLSELEAIVADAETLSHIHISVSVVNPLMLENGWTFDDSLPGATGDTLYQHEFLYQLYLHADPHYSGRVTVPVLWDKKNHTIVSNESAEIIRMFNTAFDALGAKAGEDVYKRQHQFAHRFPGCTF